MGIRNRRTTQSGGMHRRSNAAGTFATGCQGWNQRNAATTSSTTAATKCRAARGAAARGRRCLAGTPARAGRRRPAAPRSGGTGRSCRASRHPDPERRRPTSGSREIPARIPAARPGAPRGRARGASPNPSPSHASRTRTPAARSPRTHVHGSTLQRSAGWGDDAPGDRDASAARELSSMPARAGAPWAGVATTGCQGWIHGASSNRKRKHRVSDSECQKKCVIARSGWRSPAGGDVAWLVPWTAVQFWSAPIPRPVRKTWPFGSASCGTRRSPVIGPVKRSL